MRESVIYQEIIQEGKLALVLRQLTRRFGTITPELEVQARELSTAQLGDLGEALLDFSDVTDLVAWLQTHSGM